MTSKVSQSLVHLASEFLSHCPSHSSNIAHVTALPLVSGVTPHPYVLSFLLK